MCSIIFDIDNTLLSFDEFVKNSRYIVESAEILKETLKSYSREKLIKSIAKVHTLENEADQTLHKMRSYLIKDFLPPIDREDIVAISHKIDDLVDAIDEIVIKKNINYLLPEYLIFE